ncbi:hypothetical protein ES703_111263 [subsurface metagenome]
MSSAESEIKKLIEEARLWAEGIGKPVRAWVSDKQEAFVNTIAEVFPGTPHRYCRNYFMRDLADPVLEADSSAKVQLRKKIRGLRSVKRKVMTQEPSEDKKKR